MWPITSGSRLSLRDAADWCRQLAVTTQAGLPVKKALHATAKRGSGPTKRFSEELLDQLEAGEDLAGALRALRDRIPPILSTLGDVAIKTGHLPEVLRELERYFRFQLELRRKLVSQLTYPALQLVAAIFIIAALIWILGLIGGPQGTEPFDVLGLGLTGSFGAMIWLAGWATLVVAIVASYRLLRKFLAGGAAVDAFVLRIPVVGRAYELTSLTRMTFAMGLAFDSNLDARKSARLSLDASGNSHYAAQKPVVLSALKSGEDLHAAFAAPGIFPADFLDSLEAGVITGQVPEQMRRLSDDYRERAEHQLRALNTLAGWLVWLVVAGIIIFCIFRIVMVAYIGPLYDALDAAG